MKLVLDASVAIKFYAREPDSVAALAWLTSGHDLVVPDIFLVEVVQALLRHTKEGTLGRLDLDLATRDLASLVAVPHMSAELVGPAIELAHRLDHRLHDCMYLALAIRLGCPLLTADGRLVRKVRGGGLETQMLLPTDSLPS